jgi:hypothetical protein
MEARDGIPRKRLRLTRSSRVKQQSVLRLGASFGSRFRTLHLGSQPTYAIDWPNRKKGRHEQQATVVRGTIAGHDFGTFLPTTLFEPRETEPRPSGEAFYAGRPGSEFKAKHDLMKREPISPHPAINGRTESDSRFLLKQKVFAFEYAYPAKCR